jgi:hypothetical protein
VIAKHRNGPTGIVRMQFVNEYVLFKDEEPQYAEFQSSMNRRNVVPPHDSYPVEAGGNFPRNNENPF